MMDSDYCSVSAQGLLQHLAADIPTKAVCWPVFSQAGLDVFVRRDDLIHPTISGNKFYKLHHNVAHARQLGLGAVLSFGGAWSNHIHALAALGAEQGLKTIGVLRGERPKTPSSMLMDAEAMGMTLHFVSRLAYKNKQTLMPALQKQYGAFYAVPEGGANHLGALGCVAMGESVRESNANVICVPAATGGTLAGVAAGVADGQKVLGVSVLKGEGSLRSEVDRLTRELGNDRNNWHLEQGYHCGGYAKYPQYLQEFARDFEAQTQVPIEPVYGAKLWWALSDMARRGVWARGTKIIAIHTGGLQGRRGFKVL